MIIINQNKSHINIIIKEDGMNRNITLLDGAVGTSLWHYADEAGIKNEPVWKYSIEHPELVSRLTKAYYDAGAQIIQANTFGANGPAIKRSSNYAPVDVITESVKIAKETLAGTDAKISLPFGPLSMLLEPYGDLEEDECAEIYDEVIGAGVKAGADLVVLETFMDKEMMRIAATVAKKYDVPVFCSMTFEKAGKTMMGNSVQDVIDILTPIGIDAIGMNCSLGPVEALPVIKEFSEKTDIPLLFKPNAGKPILNSDGSSSAPIGAEEFAQLIKPSFEYISYVGGCCGSDPSFIAEIKKCLS